MNGFTDDEIAAEMNRRKVVKEQRELRQSDSVCLCCGTPVKSYMVTDPANPLCDTCLGD